MQCQGTRGRLPHVRYTECQQEARQCRAGDCVAGPRRGSLLIFLPSAPDLRVARAVSCRGPLASGRFRYLPAGRSVWCPGLRCPMRDGRRSVATPPCAVPDRRDHPCTCHRAIRQTLDCRSADGTAFRESHLLAWAVRRSVTTLTTSGITSPARRMTTVSPIRTSLRSTSSMLCNVALLTVTPPTKTGSSLATGVSAPVLPTLNSTSRTIVVASCGRKLVRDRPARCARHEAQATLCRDVIDLVDDTIDLVRQLGALDANRGVVLEASLHAFYQPNLARGSQPPARSALSNSCWRCGSAPPSLKPTE